MNIKILYRTCISRVNYIFRPFKSVSGNTLLNPNSGEIATLQKWIDMCRCLGEKIPSNLTLSQMNYILGLPNEKAKKKYLYTLFIKEINLEKDKKIDLKKKEIKLSERERRQQLRRSGHIKYGVWNNSMFTRISKQAIAQLGHQKLITSMIHGQTIILDFSHGNNLKNVKEKNIIVNETVSICKTNCKSIDPFNLIFFNAESNSETLINIKNKLSKSFPLQIYENNYINFFPKDKLIYLTPDSRYDMKYIDPNAVYIIGAIADCGKEEPLTLAKAKREGIKHQKLPLNRHVKFHRKSESLSIYLFFKIFKKFRETGCWRTAFGEIPKQYKPVFKIESKQREKINIEKSKEFEIDSKSALNLKEKDDL